MDNEGGNAFVVLRVDRGSIFAGNEVYGAAYLLLRDGSFASRGLKYGKVLARRIHPRVELDQEVLFNELMDCFNKKAIRHLRTICQDTGEIRCSLNKN